MYNTKRGPMNHIGLLHLIVPYLLPAVAPSPRLLRGALIKQDHGLNHAKSEQDVSTFALLPVARSQNGTDRGSYWSISLYCERME